MSNNNYFKNISGKADFIARHFAFFRLLAIVAYLFFLEILVLNVFSAAEYIPSIDEVKAKFSPIAAKNEVINSIEGYFLDKENNLAKNFQTETTSNPFEPYSKDNKAAADGVVGPSIDIVN